MAEGSAELWFDTLSRESFVRAQAIRIEERK